MAFLSRGESQLALASVRYLLTGRIGLVCVALRSQDTGMRWLCLVPRPFVESNSDRQLTADSRSMLLAPRFDDLDEPGPHPSAPWWHSARDTLDRFAGR